METDDSDSTGFRLSRDPGQTTEPRLILSSSLATAGIAGTEDLFP
jgi:hypothetical protein